jgi:Ca-activated chloride channel family protein
MKFCLFIPLLLIWSLAASAQVGLERYRADQVYESGDNYHAMQMYKQLLDHNPNDPELNYNVGNTLYRMQLYDQAKQYYQRALENTEDSQLKNDIQYNLANCEYRSKKLQESIDRYKQVLRKDPNDDDSRKNLEFALKQIEKQKSPQKNNDHPSEKDKNNKDQKDKKDKNSGEQRKPNQDKDNSKDQKNKMAQNRGLTKQEAERILDVLKNQEKDYQSKKLKDKVTKEEKTEKDW